MLLANNPIVGTIRLEPLEDAAAGRRLSDDSTLESLLASFAASDALTVDDYEPVHFITATRFSRSYSEPVIPAIAVSADLAQLLDELEAEYTQLAGCLAD